MPSSSQTLLTLWWHLCQVATSSSTGRLGPPTPEGLSQLLAPPASSPYPVCCMSSLASQPSLPCQASSTFSLSITGQGFSLHFPLP